MRCSNTGKLNGLATWSQAPNPTTSLSCADQICPCRMAAFRAQTTKESGVLRPLNLCERSACSASVHCRANSRASKISLSADRTVSMITRVCCRTPSWARRLSTPRPFSPGRSTSSSSTRALSRGCDPARELTATEFGGSLRRISDTCRHRADLPYMAMALISSQPLPSPEGSLSLRRSAFLFDSMP